MDWSVALKDSYERKNIQPSGKKKIYTQAPDNTVVITDISFRTNIPNGVNYDSQGAVLHIFQYAQNDAEEFQLCIRINKRQEFFRSLVPMNQNWKKVIGNALKSTCTWVIKAVSNCILTVDIVISASKLPYHRASYIAELFFNTDYSQFEKLMADKICYADEFFMELKAYQDDVLEYDKKELQEDKLVPTLRPYQYRAVQWMLSRENNEFQMGDQDWISDVVHKSTSICGTTLYYYVYSKILSLHMFDLPKYFRGGILADEMGLGKTVVVITLILNNPRKMELELDNDNFLMAEVQKVDDGDEPLAKKIKLNEAKTLRCLCGENDNILEDDLVQCPECLFYQHERCVGYDEHFLYFCSPCWMKQKLIKSKATLVVAPTSIFKQWFDEIEKHVDDEAWSKGVYMYEGVKKNVIQPSVLSSFDVVITTYNVLANEFGYTSEKKFNFRHERKYIRECSPITQIQWWRVCLDEAQMVEFGHNSLIVSQMAKLIPAVNHWSVTGTPIQKSVHDLFYLMDWFGVKPFNDKSFWESCLYVPFTNGDKNPMFSVMSQIFWRNSKEDIQRELTIPKQKTVYHPVKFTAVEQSFYMLEHADVLVKFTEEIERLELDLNQRLDSLSRYKLTKVLAPLLSLRQACSHHLAVCYDDISEMYKKKKGDKKKMNNINRGMTLTALMEYLQKKMSVECEEALKSHLALLRDVAGVYYNCKDYPAAVDCYRKIFSISEEFKDKIKTDYYIPRIQTLGAILKEAPTDIGSAPTKQLKTLVDELKKCVRKQDDFRASNSFQPLNTDKSMSELRKKFGTLTYLQNLDREERDPCPVCLSELDSKWCLLQCGHSYCLQCVQKMLKQSEANSMICPVCRERTKRSDIGVVDLNTDNENFDVEILGDHSSKIDVILSTLLELRRKDPYVKVLIFSKWEIVLSVLGNAFKQNSIVFKRLPSKNLKILDDFKNPEKNVTALLLPYTWGCKGLNLIEATHVFLVEPTLNPAEELQAIGRVHRMGQTKETVVHRFLVNGTIEEAIHSAVSEAKDKWDREIATLEDLKNLFVIK